MAPQLIQTGAATGKRARGRLDGRIDIEGKREKNPQVTTLRRNRLNGVAAVRVREELAVIPTYMPAAPDKNPMFLEKRVYQGSSGKVYPLPFTDRISQEKVDRQWKVVLLENEYLRVMILPEIGGRIHAIQDKTNGYDLIYRQPVIKPALVGLAGPWASGGIEFNWPHHHRPATFLPADYEIERGVDGSITVWCGDHDPMLRMKGMHGACLHPGRAYMELKVRAYNRTPFVQSFLWWANAGIRVHEAYQSFFPTDVQFVADHARRSMSAYPLAQGTYYGVDYKKRGREGVPKNERPRRFIPPHCREGNAKGSGIPDMPFYAPNDLSFYANIPTPCSYMALSSKHDFFGGYDYKKQAGIVHIADHHISPGKKQWTWGNHEFGYAWDRNLTDPDRNGEYGPYIEIMSGVFTDNQPDFSFLHPGETRIWSQYWYPIQKIGPAQMANLNAAISLKIVRQRARVGVCVTSRMNKARMQLLLRGSILLDRQCELSPEKPVVHETNLPPGVDKTDLCLRVLTGDGCEVISYSPSSPTPAEEPAPATEPPLPKRIATSDELFLTGLHLDQYHHATRCPTLYWLEALRRDPLDSRCNNSMGLWHLRRGEFVLAEKCFYQAIKRLTARNANPYDGEAYYNLGLCLSHREKFAAAYDAFYKATWNQAWASAAYHALAELDCLKHDWRAALEHVQHSLRFNAESTRARNLEVIVLHLLGRNDEAQKLLGQTLTLDPLDWWARQLAGRPMECDLQVALDLAHDYARAGFYADAIELLTNNKPPRRDLPDQSWGAEPLVGYTLGWLYEKAGRLEAAAAQRKAASQLPRDYCHPARLEEIAVLESAIRQNPNDARALYYLGNLFYDRRRHEEAIRLWERSAALDADFSVVWRNLGVGFFNVMRKPAKARLCYNRAFEANPQDARLLFERDQLWKRMVEKPEKRLLELEKHSALVRERDDLSVELCALYNQTGQPERALELLLTRRFQPWEGGEGGALGQWVRSHLALGRSAFRQRRFAEARGHFEAALAPPENLGEAKHLLANDSDVLLWLGRAASASGDYERAREYWLAAATHKGDFQDMSVRQFSEMTYYSALAWKELGRKREAARLLRQLLAFARKLQKTKAKIDYFATSLPTMLLFDDDLQAREVTRALLMQAQARLGLGHVAQAGRLLKAVLRRDPNHGLAADLMAEFQA